MDILATPEFWVAVSFFLFLALLFYFGVHKKVGKALDARAAAIAKEIEEAKALREEAEKVLTDYRAKQEGAAKEAGSAPNKNFGHGSASSGGTSGSIPEES